MRTLGILYTTNRIAEELLKEVVSNIGKALQYARSQGQETDVIISSWETMEVPEGVENLKFLFREGGHLNIALQIWKVCEIYKKRYPDEKVLVCLMEHDVLYHERYLYEVTKFFNSEEDMSGAWVRGHIGMNQTGYCKDMWHHHPLSMATMELDRMLIHIEEKIHILLDQGMTCLEPHHYDLKEYQPEIPLAIHVNYNKTDRCHHLTNHYDCYEIESTLPQELQGWPHVGYYLDKLFHGAVIPPQYTPPELLPNDLVFVTAQPAQGKFIWQLAIQLLNFQDVGIPMDRCYYCMIKQQSEYPASYYALKKKWPNVHWFEIDDDRPTKHYVSSVRPYVLSKLFSLYPILNNKYVFYMDSDVIFNRLPDFRPMVEDGIAHLSDTVSYIGYDYLKQFGKDEEYVNTMCDIIRVRKDLVIENQANSGGAQYLFPKGSLSVAYWNKVYRDCEVLYPLLDRMIESDKSAYNATRPPEAGDLYTLQHWCVDMWCVLWNLWLLGVKTVCDPVLAFAWATSPIQEFEQHNLYHDAGVTADKSHEMFYKGGFETLPDHIDASTYRTDLCSIKYLEYVQRVIASNKV
jgi:hypothetical protein